jgi:TRAP-type C4-dicarboxylate transport system permease small subunit
MVFQLIGLAVSFLVLMGVGYGVGMHRKLAERFPDDPPVARWMRLGDTMLGLVEQIALFSMLVFLVVVTVLWFLTEHFSSTPLEGASYDVRYTCFLIAMVGGAFAAHHRRLLAMDFVSHFLPGKVKSWTRVLNTAFACVIAFVFFKYAHRLYEAQTTERHTRGAHEHWMPEAGANAAMMIGAELLLLHLLVQIVIDLDYLVRGKLPPEPQMGAA